MADYGCETLLEFELKRRAKGLMTQFGYDYNTAYRVAVKEAMINGDVVIVNKRPRYIKPTAADGRVA